MISLLARIVETKELIVVYYAPTKDPEGKDWYCSEKHTWYKPSDLEFVDNTETTERRKTIWQSDSLPTIQRIIEMLWDEGDIEIISRMPDIMNKIKTRML